MRRKVIICGRYNQLVDYCREHKLSPSQVAWISRPEQLHGLELQEEDVVRTGTPPEMLAEIEAILLTRIRHTQSKGHDA